MPTRINPISSQPHFGNRRYGSTVSSTSKNAQRLLRAAGMSDLEGMLSLSSKVQETLGVSGIYPLAKNIMVTVSPHRRGHSILIHKSGKRQRHNHWLDIRIRPGQQPDIRYHSQKRLFGGWPKVRIEQTPHVLQWLNSLQTRFISSFHKKTP